MTETIQAQELQVRMDAPEGAVILDVRAADAYRAWHIQGERVTSLNIQNSRLKAEGIAAFPEIPRNREVVAVCAHGVAARETANLLAAGGYRVVVLEGGMSAWAEYLRHVPIASSERCEVYQIQRPGKGCLSYVIVSDGDALVVDAGRNITYYRELAATLQVRIRHVVDTHLHADHVSGGRALAESCNAPYWIAPEEMHGATGDFSPLADGGSLSIGNSGCQIAAIATPGHTAGSTSFLVDNQFLLCGDTVFVSGLGRPDLKGRAEEMAGRLYGTVHNRLAALSEDLWVLPAHYSDAGEANPQGFVGARLGDIKARNPLLKETDRTRFVNTLVSRVGETPPNYETVTEVNRGLVHLPDETLSELETGPNRCAAR